MADPTTTPTATGARTAARGVVRPPRLARFPALALALIVAAGSLANIANPALLRAPEATFWDGHWADAYQLAFDGASPLLAPSRTVWGLLDLLVFGQGRPGVLVGRDGWLYSSEEFDVSPQPDAALSAWASVVVETRDQLAGHGIELVVALVPSKASLVPDHAPAPLPAAAARRYDDALVRLGDAGVTVVDLRPPLREADAEDDVYLRTDTHWTPYGAAAAASAIARTVRDRATLPHTAETVFATEVLGHEPLLGDLTAFLDLGSFAGTVGPKPDLLERRRTVNVSPGTDPFAEVALPVTLVGTSYSADARWNLAGALREALGVDLLEAAVTGAGALEPMRRYLASDAFTNAPPEVVVWEIPERYLTLAGALPVPEAGP
jgi:alginate O-acetyltransferase complex protein AlgJ